MQFLPKLQMLLYQGFDENYVTLNIICNHSISCQLSSYISFVYAETRKIGNLRKIKLLLQPVNARGNSKMYFFTVHGIVSTGM